MKIFKYALETAPRLVITDGTPHATLTVPLDDVLHCGVSALPVAVWPAVLQALDTVLRAAVESMHQTRRAGPAMPDPACQLFWLEDTLVPPLLNGPPEQ